jgi:hypothetical protein
MVAATAASQALDVSTASELGSLLLCYRSIRDPHARQYAGVHVAAVRERFGLPHATEASGVVAAPAARLLPVHPAIARARSAMEMEPRSSLVCVQGIRERSYRAGGFLLLVRCALERGDIEVARAIAARIGTHLFSQVAQLDIAYALYRRGAIRDALRLLHAITDRRLAARVTTVRSELRLTVRRNSEQWSGIDEELVRAAYREPLWTCTRERLDIELRDLVLRSIMYLRVGMRSRDAWLLDEAARHATRVVRDSAARRYWLDVAERSAIDIDEALLAMQKHDNARALDLLRAEHVAVRARRLVTRELPEPARRGLAALPIENGNARSIERAIYDEAIALSPLAPAKRRVLIATAQHCLRSALAAPNDWHADVIAARLRTLAHLGGELATEALRKAFMTLPAHANVTLQLVDAYAQLDARAAARHVLARMTQLHAANVDVERALRMIELHGGLPAGFWQAYARARHELTRAHYEAATWLARLCEKTNAHVDTLLRILRALPSQTVIPATAEQLLAELHDVPQKLVGLEHTGVAAALVKDTQLLEAMLLARPASVDRKMPVWSTEQWAKRLRAAIRCATVHPEQLAKYVRKVGRRHWYDALRASRLEDLGVRAITTLAIGRDEYRLRLLDKRIDLFTYLRFADVPARSCFRTDSSIALEVDCLEPWKDPLSLVCHVERRRGDAFEPRGFWFGSFAAVDGAPALVMNSLHVRPNDPELREQIVGAFERSICAPLGITRIGIANDHGGAGKLPAAYVKRDVVAMRFRALAIDGWTLRSTYDDISCQANEPIKLTELYWRT